MIKEDMVYMLSRFTDDPNFEGFGTVGLGFPRAVPQVRDSRDWKVARLSPTWQPTRVVGNVRSSNDFPGLAGHPAFSGRAVEILRDLLEPNGELLPLESSLGRYYAYNLTAVADALNWKSSEIRWLRKPITALSIERYEFYLNRLKDLRIFRIVEQPSKIYVTIQFVERVKLHKLNGFKFVPVWPLASDISWRKLDKEMRIGEIS